MRAFPLAVALLLAVPLLPLEPARAAALTTTQSGVLTGSGLGIHVAKVVPWRATHALLVPPGATRVTVGLAASDPYVTLDPSDDAGLGPGWWAFVADKDGEIVATSPTTRGASSVTVDWTTIHARGFGVWTMGVECSSCVATSYTMTGIVEMAARGANATLDTDHLLVVPGEASGDTATVLNTGASTETFHLAASAPAGWSVRAHDDITLAPGASGTLDVDVKPPTGVRPGDRATIGLDVVAADGVVLDHATIDALDSPAIADAREHGHAVIAIIEFDTPNPYHHDFEGPASLPDHPQFALDNYPASARPLHLTLDAPTYDAAMQADAATWASAKANTLYYIPGTRFIGYISFGSPPHPDEGGHNTGTTSLAAGALGEAPDAYIVSVGGDWITGIRWAARQPWIDAMSMSLGLWAGTPTVGVTEPAQAGSGTLYVPFSIPYAQKLAYESGKRVFTGTSQGWEAGVGTSDGTVPSAGASGPCPYNWIGDFSGSPWTYAIETYHPWTELPWRTSCNPDIVAKGDDLVAASALSLDGHNDFGHTSGATPQAAGAYVRLVQAGREKLGDGRVGPRPQGLAALGDAVLAVAHEHAKLPKCGPLADGVLTTREAERAMLHGLEQVDTVTSYQRHGSDPRWQQDATVVPPGNAFASEGYGLLTPSARAAQLDILLGKADPLRAADDALATAGWAARQAFWNPQMQDEVWVF